MREAVGASRGTSSLHWALSSFCRARYRPHLAQRPRGRIGVGLGFGLQNITNNFFSGLILLFERPIKMGDRVEIGGVVGEVREIGARATTIVTDESVATIVPNSQFVWNA